MADKFESLTKNVKDLRDGTTLHPGVDSFTVESGRGDTYDDGEVTLYAHGEYPRHSVMHGREMRCWVSEFGSWSEAREAVKAAGIEKITDFWDDGGSTHIPVEFLISHLPDDTDY